METVNTILIFLLGVAVGSGFWSCRKKSERCERRKKLYLRLATKAFFRKNNNRFYGTKFILKGLI